MGRIPHLTAEEQTPDQQQIGAAIAGARSGTLGGPFAIWLRIPEIAARANHFSERIRLQSKIEPRLFELMVLTVARSFTAQYEWHAHARHALNQGITPEIVEAIRLRRTPPFVRDDERVVYDTVTELMQTRTLGDAAYERALGTFGQELLIEFITAIGFYAMIALVLNAFDAPVPSDKPLPA